MTNKHCQAHNSTPPIQCQRYKGSEQPSSPTPSCTDADSEAERVSDSLKGKRPVSGQIRECSPVCLHSL